jgi:hypothetical protein
VTDLSLATIAPRAVDAEEQQRIAVRAVRTHMAAAITAVTKSALMVHAAEVMDILVRAVHLARAAARMGGVVTRLAIAQLVRLNLGAALPRKAYKNKWYIRLLYTCLKVYCRSLSLWVEWSGLLWCWSLLDVRKFREVNWYIEPDSTRSLSVNRLSAKMQRFAQRPPVFLLEGICNIF